MNDIKNIWEILHSYEADIFGYIKHAVGSADIARDIYQDVYLQALQNIHQLDSDRSLKNWLMTVTRNRVINYYREKTRRDYVTIQDDIKQTDIESDADYEKHISQALKNLPDSQKEVFISRELDGLSYEELGIKMNLSKAAVTSLLDRSRKNFARELLISFMPDSLKMNANKLTLEDLARFVDSFDSMDMLLSKIEKRSQHYFANIYKNWDEIRQQFVDTNQFNQIVKYLSDQKNKLTLDLGSGTGFISLHCALNGADVIAVDMNKKMLMKQAALKFKLNVKNINLVQADITQLPINEGYFDQVFITLVLHHINDPFAMLHKTARMLRPKGNIIIIDFVRHSDRNFADQMHDLWLGFEPDKIQKWFKKIGLKMIDSSIWRSDQQYEVFYQIYSE